jgi:hypothetical protein
MLKKLEPIFIERSFVPKLLSFFAPIEIGAITLGFVVFSRGTVSDSTRRHETIHFQQYLETLFVGFLLLYFYDYCRSKLFRKPPKMEVDESPDMTQKVIQKKRAAGYMSFMILMFAMVNIQPDSDMLSGVVVRDTASFRKAASDPYLSLLSDGKRTYRINGEVVTVDTSKPGWAVTLLLKNAQGSN